MQPARLAGGGYRKARHGKVVIPRRIGLDPLAIKSRVLLIKQRVEHVLALLFQADAPSRRAHRVHHQRFGRVDEKTFVLEQRKEEVAIFPPRLGEPLIETAYGRERRAAAEAVGGDELRHLEPRRIAFVIRGARTQRHDQFPPRAGNPGAEGRQARFEPARRGQAVIVGECDNLPARGAPALVARYGRAAAAVSPQITDRDRCPFRPPLHHTPRLLRAGIVGDDDLVRSGIDRLQHQRAEAPPQQRRTFVAGYDDRGERYSFRPPLFLDQKRADGQRVERRCPEGFERVARRADNRLAARVE